MIIFASNLSFIQKFCITNNLLIESVIGDFVSVCREFKRILPSDVFTLAALFALLSTALFLGIPIYGLGSTLL